MRPILFAMSALALTLVHLDAQAVAVGRTPGSFNVTSTGEATYSIPIAVPPGVNGLTPQLALTYASRSRQSIAGWGWNISGALAITRCNSTVAQDGAPRGVDDSLQDRYCLNGNKLRLVSGTYGVAGSEYGTEIETFSRIRAYGSSGTGPSYFIVEGRDGLKYEFGRTSDSLIQIKGKTTARSWALNKVSDRDNNEIKYQYIRDLYGAYRLDLVTYGGNSQQGTPAIYSIDLIYESRPQEEVLITNFAGSNIREYNRLDRIDVLYNSTTLYRRYDLTYQSTLSAANHSRLASVVECAGSTPECLPATTFTYENSPALDPESNTGTVVPVTSVLPLPLDINGDGRGDMVYPNGTGPWMVMFANSTGGYNAPVNTGVASTGAAGAIPFDYNADGKDDLLVPYSGGTWWVLYGSASGLSAPANTSAAATATGTGANARALDVDGDGQDDLVWADLNPVQYGGGDVIRWRRKIPGGAFAATATDLITPLPADQMIPTGVFGGWAQKMTSRVPDFNGDGRDDLAFRKYIRTNNQLVAGGSGGATTAVVWKYSYRLVVTCPGVTDCLTAAGGVASEPYFGDFNRDGLTDLFYFDGDGFWKYRFSTGTGFTNAASAGSLSSYLNVMIVDWDGDGYDDVLMDHTATSTWHVLRSTGEVLQAAVTTGVSSAGTTSQVVTDMNGDGLPELAYRGSGNTWRYKARPVTLDLQDQLVSATDGFGVSATFNYAPITLSTVYTKGSGATYPKSEFQEALWVVNSLVATDSTGTSSTYTLTFTYESGRLDLPGRGFLGFGKRTVVDSRLGYNLKTIETYNQDFPWIGMLASVEQKQSNGLSISLTTNTWASLSWGTPQSTERRFPYVSVREVDEHELSGTGPKFRNTKTTVASISSISGLILDSNTVTKEEPAGSSKTERVLHTSPLDDIANWCIGRPTDTAITNSHTLANGVAITRSFDAAWDGIKCRPTQRRIEPDNASWRVTTDLLYDSFGNVRTETVTGAGMLARTTLIGWGTDGHFPRSVTNALSQVTNQAWNDAVGRPSSLTDPNGIQVTWSYDSFGRPDTETRADGTKQKWTYSNVCSTCGPRYRYHVQVDETQSDNTLIRRRYSYLTQLDQVFLERVRLLNSDYSVAASRDFDARGRLIKQFVPYMDGGSDDGSRRWTYDQLDRVVTDRLYTSAGTIERETLYAYSGLSSTVTDPLLHTTTQTFSPWGDLLSVEDALSGAVSHEYNAFGELKKTSDATGNPVATVSYVDVRGLRTGLNDMNLGNWTFVPNALGEVTSQKDAIGQTTSQSTTFEYDLLGRMTKRTEPDGTISNWIWGSNLAADEIGRLNKVTGPGYEDNLTYDTTGRLKSRMMKFDGLPTQYQFDFSYNAIGELDTLTYPATTGSDPFKLKYGYGNGYLTAIREYTGNVLNKTYWSLTDLNARGQAIEEFYNDATLPMNTSFKPLTGEITTRQFGTSALPTSVQNLSYTWDIAGNLKERKDLRQNLTETASYDGLNRLTQISGPAGTLTIGYDAIGNITSRSDVNGGSAWLYDTTKRNAVKTAGSFTYTYDDNGNMTSRNTVSQTWTSGNLPSTLATSTSTTQFSYAPDRSRWKQVANYVSGQETTLYIGGLLEKQTMPSPLPTRWKHRIATPSGEVQYVRYSPGGSETFYLPSDHAGSVDAVLNSAGTVLVRTSFDAWGARRDDDWVGAPSSGELQQIADTTRAGFTSHEMIDNVGLIHMNGRVYDAAIGRFMSADPFVIPMLGTQGLNRYAYVGNQPLTYVDPNGFSPDDSPDDLPLPPLPDPCAYFGCYPGYPGDRHNGGRAGMPGWGIVDGNPYNNPRNGGFYKWQKFAPSITADHINVSAIASAGLRGIGVVLVPNLVRLGDEGIHGTWGGNTSGFLKGGYNALLNFTASTSPVLTAQRMLGYGPRELEIAEDQLEGAAVFDVLSLAFGAVALERALAARGPLALGRVGPGAYAGESISARSTARDFTAAERAEINRIGSNTGCHTCGTTNPGTKSGNFVLDHQPPNALNPPGGPQRLYPHCLICSREQGLEIARMLQSGGGR